MGGGAAETSFSDVNTAIGYKKLKEQISSQKMKHFLQQVQSFLNKNLSGAPYQLIPRRELNAVTNSLASTLWR